MIFESTVLLSRWMKHPTLGVVPRLSGVPRDKIDGSGQWPVPTTPSIYDDVQDRELIGKDLRPVNTPALVVFVEQRIVSDSKDAGNDVYERNKTFSATISYITNDEVPDKAMREGAFTLRATKQCLREFNKQVLSAGYRDYNKVKLVKIGPVVIHMISGAVGASNLWGFIDATLTVIDEDP
jgi:hypothetical protein